NARFLGGHRCNDTRGAEGLGPAPAGGASGAQGARAAGRAPANAKLGAEARPSDPTPARRESRVRDSHTGPLVSYGVLVVDQPDGKGKKPSLDRGRAAEPQEGEENSSGRGPQPNQLPLGSFLDTPHTLLVEPVVLTWLSERLRQE